MPKPPPALPQPPVSPLSDTPLSSSILSLDSWRQWSINQLQWRLLSPCWFSSLLAATVSFYNTDRNTDLSALWYIGFKPQTWSLSFSSVAEQFYVLESTILFKCVTLDCYVCLVSVLPTHLPDMHDGKICTLIQPNKFLWHLSALMVCKCVWVINLREGLTFLWTSTPSYEWMCVCGCVVYFGERTNKNKWLCVCVHAHL